MNEEQIQQEFVLSEEPGLMESDRPEYTLDYLQNEFEKHGTEHLNRERLYALSHADKVLHQNRFWTRELF